jgi:hypothetical protein
MANRKPLSTKGRSRRPLAFGDLLRTAPKIKNFRRVRLSGLLFRSGDRGKFILQTADGTFYELNSGSVEHFQVLERRGEFTVVEVEVPASAISRDAPPAQSPIAKGSPVDDFLAVSSGSSSATDAQAHLNLLKEDPAHPIHQYWQFDRTGDSLFKDVDHPLSSSQKSRQ